MYHGGGNVGESREEDVYGASESFHDQLLDQLGETELTERQQYIMEYLIGSLDDDGLLRKDLSAISDELAVYHNLDVSEGDVESILHCCRSSTPQALEHARCRSAC